MYAPRQPSILGERVFVRKLPLGAIERPFGGREAAQKGGQLTNRSHGSSAIDRGRVRGPVARSH